jgi:homoserine kinase
VSPAPEPAARAPLRARVPASTSNLGPGFDCLGLALSLWLEVELELEGPGEAPRAGRREGEAAAWPVEGDLLARAFATGLQRAGLPPTGGVLHARSEIPVARGLGSSGAAIAAGLLLAAALAKEPPERMQLCALGCELEGHPDNSTASLLGGLTAALPVDGRLVVARPALHPSLRFAVAWPARPVPTELARKVLPASVPFADAVENPRRLALLLEGLRTADPELLRLGGEDRLHVRHRLALIPGAARALELANDAGAFLATLSGSGSTVIALTDAARAERVADALASGLEDAPVERRVLEAVLEAPRVVAGEA